MNFDLHPSARTSFNAQANQVAESAILKPSPAQKVPSGFKPDVHSSFNFTSEHLRGPVQRFETDRDGNHISRFIDTGSGFVGFDQTGYAKLRKLAFAMQKTDALRNSLSVRFIEDALFEWSLEKLKRGTDLTACEYVASKAQEAVRHQEIWIPVYRLNIQSPFSLGPVIFKTVTRQMISEWQDSVKERVKEQPQVLFKLERDKKELLGFAAATYEQEGEPERATEMASELADKAISILRLFSVANFDPRQFSYCVPLGSHQRYGHHYITVRDGKIVGEARGITMKGQYPWVIDDGLLNEMKLAGLNTMSALFGKEVKSDLEETVLDALLLYSKAALVPTLAEKLLYMFAALESILLRDEKESITESISERLAFMSADNADTRLAARKTIKQAYGVRSRFVHHGKRDATDLSEFFQYAWTGISRITEIAGRFSTKMDLLDHIERYKYR